MWSSTFLTFLNLWGLATAIPVNDFAVRQDSDLPRLVIYYQTTHDSNGNPISMLPLVEEQGIALTHLIVCSFHISEGSDIHLNDHPPDDASFNTLWSEAQVLQDAGVRIMGMVGGAAAGSFETSTLDGDDATFEQYYGQLHDVISKYKLQGMDLDVEQSMSQDGITRLVSRLNSDFGSDFLVTLAPVATAMTSGGGGLSGFDYDTLEDAAGSSVAFYNVQFYNGFGSMDSPADYESAVGRGWSADKLVAGQLTAPSNGGSGYVDFPEINSTIEALRSEYGQIGGVMGWEYFNSEPGGTSSPWQWAQELTEILRPGQAPRLKISTETASHLEQAYEQSRVASRPDSRIKHAQVANYRAMVN